MKKALISLALVLGVTSALAVDYVMNVKTGSGTTMFNVSDVQEVTFT